MRLKKALIVSDADAFIGRGEVRPFIRFQGGPVNSPAAGVQGVKTDMPEGVLNRRAVLTGSEL
jgi:hypothetical protein